MDKVGEVVQLILLLLSIERHTHHDKCRHTRKATQLAPVIVEVFGEDALLATRIMARESSFRWQVVSPRGSVGYMGINPVGAQTHICKGLKYDTDVRQHLQCAHRIMRHYQGICNTTDPTRWLSLYNGRRYCGPSDYSRKILTTYP